MRVWLQCRPNRNLNLNPIVTTKAISAWRECPIRWRLSIRVRSRYLVRTRRSLSHSCSHSHNQGLEYWTPTILGIAMSAAINLGIPSISISISIIVSDYDGSRVSTMCSTKVAAAVAAATAALITRSLIIVAGRFPIPSLMLIFIAMLMLVLMDLPMPMAMAMIRFVELELPVPAERVVVVVVLRSSRPL